MRVGHLAMADPDMLTPSSILLAVESISHVKCYLPDNHSLLCSIVTLCWFCDPAPRFSRQVIENDFEFFS